MTHGTSWRGPVWKSSWHCMEHPDARRRPMQESFWARVRKKSRRPADPLLLEPLQVGLTRRQVVESGYEQGQEASLRQACGDSAVRGGAVSRAYFFPWLRAGWSRQELPREPPRSVARAWHLPHSPPEWLALVRRWSPYRSTRPGATCHGSATPVPLPKPPRRMRQSRKDGSGNLRRHEECPQPQNGIAYG